MSLPKILPVTCRLQHVGPGCTYVVIPGKAEDPIEDLDAVLAQGARTIVLQKDKAGKYGQLCKSGLRDGVRYVFVACARKALAHYAARAAGFPTKKLRVIGVAGVDDSDKFCEILAGLLECEGHTVAIIRSNDSAELGVPGSDYLQHCLAQCVAQGVTHVILVIAPYSLTRGSLYEIEFAHTVLAHASIESDVAAQGLLANRGASGHVHLSLTEWGQKMSQEKIGMSMSVIVHEKAPDVLVGTPVKVYVIASPDQQTHTVSHAAQAVTILAQDMDGCSGRDVAFACSVAHACDVPWQTLVEVFEE